MNTDNVNTVTLDIRSYNALKAQNQRLNMVLDDILSKARLTEDRQSMTFDDDDMNAALKFCFLDAWKKRLATLRTQATRYGFPQSDKKPSNKGEP